MRIITIAGVAAMAMALSGCLSTPVERAGAGALTGAAVSSITGGNVLTGALIGGAAGAVSCGVPGLPRCQ
ncbi:MAG: hypothetical protein ACK4TB_10220 [Gemmobacter sp.]